MPFKIFSDGTANLSGEYLKNVTLLPCNYRDDTNEYVYNGVLEDFDFKSFYDSIRAGKQYKTSLINTEEFKSCFTPVLREGFDVIYISMASGISGTCQAANLAAEELREEFPDRVIRIIDSRTCGMGSGLQVIRAAELLQQGKEAAEAADIMESEVQHYCSYFTVDNLMNLVRTGRVSKAVAVAAGVLDIKPILFGSMDAKIVNCGKCRGRKKSMMMLAAKFKEKAVDISDHIVAISHGDCLADAETLAGMIRAIGEPRQILILPHEPFSGGHVGPGMLGLFFWGETR